MSYSLFLDDYRSPKVLNDTREWIVVRNYEEFVEIVKKQGLPKIISFDHDLGPKSYEHTVNGIFDYNTLDEKTGYHCAKFLIEYCMDNKLPLPDYQIHSMNPVGRENIKSLLENFRKHQKEQRI